jgi:hypothetical protein
MEFYDREEQEMEARRDSAFRGVPWSPGLERKPGVVEFRPCAASTPAFFVHRPRSSCLGAWDCSLRDLLPVVPPQVRPQHRPQHALFVVHVLAEHGRVLLNSGNHRRARHQHVGQHGLEDPQQVGAAISQSALFVMERLRGRAINGPAICKAPERHVLQRVVVAFSGTR